MYTTLAEYKAELEEMWGEKMFLRLDLTDRE